MKQHYTYYKQPSVAFVPDSNAWNRTLLYVYKDNVIRESEQVGLIAQYLIREDSINVTLYSKFATKNSYDVALFAQNEFDSVPMAGFAINLDISLLIY